MDKLASIFREVFEDPDLDISDLNRKNFPDWDSFAQVKIVLGIEEEFGIKLSMDDVAVITSVEEFRRLISEKTQARV